MHFYVSLFIVSVSIINTDSRHVNNRIIGGELAREGQFPFQVSLRHENKHMCGGSIINDHWIVTAAHCVAGYKSKDFLVVTGTTKLNFPGNIYQAKQLIFHENYQGIDIICDIGLVQTVDSIIYSKNVQPIALNTKAIGEGIPLIVAGWGSKELWGPSSEDLQYLNVLSVDQKECIELQKPFIVDDGMLCTFWKTGHGTCHGDSGSPLISNNELVGIVSWGRPCARGYPDVFTRVSEFILWIQNNIKE